MFLRSGDEESMVLYLLKRSQQEPSITSLTFENILKYQNDDAILEALVELLQDKQQQEQQQPPPRTWTQINCCYDIQRANKFNPSNGNNENNDNKEGNAFETFQRRKQKWQSTLEPIAREKKFILNFSTKGGDSALVLSKETHQNIKGAIKQLERSTVTSKKFLSLEFSDFLSYVDDNENDGDFDALLNAVVAMIRQAGSFFEGVKCGYTVRSKHVETWLAIKEKIISVIGPVATEIGFKLSFDGTIYFSSKEFLGGRSVGSISSISSNEPSIATMISILQQAEKDHDIRTIHFDDTQPPDESLEAAIIHLLGCDDRRWSMISNGISLGDKTDKPSRAWDITSMLEDINVNVGKQKGFEAVGMAKSWEAVGRGNSTMYIEFRYADMSTSPSKAAPIDWFESPNEAEEELRENYGFFRILDKVKQNDGKLTTLHVATSSFKDCAAAAANILLEGNDNTTVTTIEIEHFDYKFTGSWEEDDGVQRLFAALGQKLTNVKKLIFFNMGIGTSIDADSLAMVLRHFTQLEVIELRDLEVCGDAVDDDDDDEGDEVVEDPAAEALGEALKSLVHLKRLSLNQCVDEEGDSHPLVIETMVKAVATLPNFQTLSLDIYSFDEALPPLCSSEAIVSLLSGNSSSLEKISLGLPIIISDQDVISIMESINSKKDSKLNSFQLNIGRTKTTNEKKSMLVGVDGLTSIGTMLRSNKTLKNFSMDVGIISRDVHDVHVAKLLQQSLVTSDNPSEETTLLENFRIVAHSRGGVEDDDEEEEVEHEGLKNNDNDDDERGIIRSETCHAIAEIIRSNTKLVSLCIDFGELHDDGCAIEIVQALSERINQTKTSSSTSSSSSTNMFPLKKLSVSGHLGEEASAMFQKLQDDEMDKATTTTTTTMGGDDDDGHPTNGNNSRSNSRARSASSVGSVGSRSRWEHSIFGDGINFERH